MGKPKRKLIIRQSHVTFEELAEIERTIRRTEAQPTTLSLEDIHVADKVFQIRKDYRGEPEFDHEHIIGLVDAIGISGALDPICVTAIGDKFYLVDGHHRFFAYLTAEWPYSIPVSVFAGSLVEAEGKAGEENHKNKLPVSKESKLEHAWTRTRRGGLSIAQLIKTTGVSQGTIANMRRGLRSIQEKGGDPWQYTWKSYLRGESKSESFDRETWVDQKSTELAQRICADRSFKVVQWPEVLVEAIKKVSPGLPYKMVELWSDIAEDFVQHIVQEEGLGAELLDI